VHIIELYRRDFVDWKFNTTLPYKEFRFGDGWRERNKALDFDLTRLKKVEVGNGDVCTEDILYLRLLGFFMSRTSYTRQGKTALDIGMRDEQVETHLGSVLLDGTSEDNKLDKTKPLADFTIRSESFRGTYARIRNPNFAWYFYNELPCIGPKQEKALLEGIITSCALETISSPDRRHKVIFKTKNPMHAKFVKAFSYLQKLPCSELNYLAYDDTLGEYPVYSMWYFKPEYLEDFIINGEHFSELKEAVKELPNYPEETVYSTQNNFARSVWYDWAEKMGIISIKKRNELKAETEKIHNALRNLELEWDELKRQKENPNLEEFEGKDNSKLMISLREAEFEEREDALRERMAELNEQRYNLEPKKRKKSGSDSYAKKQYKDQQAKDRVGE